MSRLRSEESAHSRPAFDRGLSGAGRCGLFLPCPAPFLPPMAAPHSRAKPSASRQHDGSAPPNGNVRITQMARYLSGDGCPRCGSYACAPCTRPGRTPVPSPGVFARSPLRSVCSPASVPFVSALSLCGCSLPSRMLNGAGTPAQPCRHARLTQRVASPHAARRLAGSTRKS